MTVTQIINMQQFHVDEELTMFIRDKLITYLKLNFCVKNKNDYSFEIRDLQINLIQNLIG